MGDQEQRAGVGVQRLLELLDGGQVEVVGRLVEHEQVDPAGLQQRQRGAGALARRQRRRGPQHVVGAQPELGQQCAHVGLARSGTCSPNARSRVVAVEQPPGLVDLADDHARPERGRALVEGTRPSSTASSVDLPEPFGPVMRDAVGPVDLQVTGPR